MIARLRVDMKLNALQPMDALPQYKLNRLACAACAQGYMGVNSSNLPGQYPDVGWSASPLNTCALPGNTCDGQGRPLPLTAHVYAPKHWFEACTW